MSPPELTGAILVGGASRRFGSDKAAAGVVPLALRGWRAVSALTPEVHLVGGAGATFADPLRGLPRLHDARPGQGPLAGVEAALAHARATGARGVVVLACDLPLVDPPALAGLVEGWAASPSPEATLALPAAPPQPLAAVWGVGLLPAVTAALDAGRRRVLDLVDEVAAAWIPADVLGAAVGLSGRDALWNVNRVGELRHLPAAPLPPVVCVVGWKDSGKTTATVALLRGLARRGVRAAAAKHGHGFRLDPPGTDSWRLKQEARAPAVLLAGPTAEVLQRDPDPGPEPGLAARIRRHLSDAPLVVAEGWKGEGWAAIEVQGEAAAEPIVPREGPEAGRCLARVAPGGRDGALDRDDPHLGDRLAEVVLRRIPGLGPGDGRRG